MITSFLSRAVQKITSVFPDRPTQVEDDFSIFEDALKGLSEADPLYHPGPYWERHRRPLEEYLRSHGLQNYRLGDAVPEDPKYILRRFGAGEPRIPEPSHLTQSQWNNLRYDFADTYGKLVNAAPLSRLSISTAGNPGDVFRIKRRTYTSNALNFYMRYAYLCQFLDFQKISTIVEIGPGSGLQTEILHKLHPHLTSYLFDIPPQSYIGNQYLKHVFPGKVVGLEQTRSLTEPLQGEPGQIYIFNSWQIPLVRNQRIDLFWNAASFNEMEPHLVDNYLSFISPQAENLYLMSIMKGSRVGISDYRRFLPGHRCYALASLLLADGQLSSRYSNSLWRRPAS